MIRRLQAILWLRWRYLLSNKIILFVCAITPILDFYLLQALPDVHGEFFFLGTAIGMIYSITAGTFTSMMVGEEKEKQIIRTFILTGMKSYEYLISIFFFPLIFSILSCLVLPLIFGITFPNYGVYFIIVILTSLAFILLNFLIGLISKNQNQSSLFSLLIFFGATFFPMFTSQSKLMASITDYSFFGANSVYLNKLNAYQLNSISFYSLIVWDLIFVLAVLRFFKWNQKN